jgi:hypothetical protein
MKMLKQDKINLITALVSIGVLIIGALAIHQIGVKQSKYPPPDVPAFTYTNNQELIDSTKKDLDRTLIQLEMVIEQLERLDKALEKLDNLLQTP